MNITPPLNSFSCQNIVNGFTRPYIRSNAWISGFNNPSPWLTIKWDVPQQIHSVTLFFDTDFDHPMESSQMGHPEDIIPFCIRKYRIKDENGNIIKSFSPREKRKVIMPETAMMLMKMMNAATRMGVIHPPFFVGEPWLARPWSL